MQTYLVVTPSRGLIHSRTVEAVHANVASAGPELRPASSPWWIVSHDLPIPDAHNDVVRRALAHTPDLIWFVEEDMVPRRRALQRLHQELQRTGAAMAVLDYPVGESPSHSSVLHAPDGAPWCSGLGCALIPRRTFEKLDPTEPWFRSDRQIQLTKRHRGTSSPNPRGWSVGAAAEVDVKEIERACEYGGHDVYFGLRLTAAGLPIVEVPPAEMLSGHAKLRNWGKQKTNRGFHTVEVLDQIERWH